jgi:hypothetical protein
MYLRMREFSRFSDRLGGNAVTAAPTKMYEIRRLRTKMYLAEPIPGYGPRAGRV